MKQPSVVRISGAWWRILLLLCGPLLLYGLGCDSPHKYRQEQLREAAKQLAFPQATLQEIELLLDSSASMRGFALAAVKNEHDPSASWESLFVGIDSLPNHFFDKAGGQTERSAAPTPAPRSNSLPRQALRLVRFGGREETLSGPASLVSMMLGIQPLAPIGGVALSSSWASRSCGKQSSVEGRVRNAIDSLFSERETCLGLAFDRATALPADPSLRIVLTDSEQLAADNSENCPLGNNPAPTQDRLYEWVHSSGRFGAIAIFNLPYEGWRVGALTRNYCGCASRNLFAYLLGPSASAVEEAYAQISSRWKGPASDIAFLPLAPRPASEYTIKMTISQDKKGDIPVSIDNQRQNLDPESGQLPVFYFRLTEDRVTVSFDIAKAAFGGMHFLKDDSLSQMIAWRDRPSLLEDSASTKKNTTSTFRLTQGDGGFEFVRLPGLAEGPRKVAYAREAQFISSARKAEEKDLIDIHLDGTWEIRKRPGVAHACDIYVFELYEQGGKMVETIVSKTPLLTKINPLCSGLEGIAEQVRHVYQDTPIARFLLHIDS